MNRIGMLLVVLAVAGLVALGTACDSGKQSEASPQAGGVQSPGPDAIGAAVSQVSANQQVGLWVTGQGSVTAVPDLALLSLGVEARSETVAQAMAQASDAMNRIFQALKSRGLTDRDIKTSQFSIQPIYATVKPDPRLPGGQVVEEQRIVGYRVSNIVTAKVRSLDQVGVLIDEAAQAGGDLTRVQGVSFTIEDATALQREARDKAVRDALQKAQQIAAQAGVRLGKPTLIQESGGFVPAPFARAALAEAAPPISPGETEVSVSVQMTFAIE